MNLKIALLLLVLWQFDANSRMVRESSAGSYPSSCECNPFAFSYVGDMESDTNSFMSQIGGHLGIEFLQCLRQTYVI
jgi:hypothetical protein